MSNQKGAVIRVGKRDDLNNTFLGDMHTPSFARTSPALYRTRLPCGRLIEEDVGASEGRRAGEGRRNGQTKKKKKIFRSRNREGKEQLYCQIIAGAFNLMPTQIGTMLGVCFTT